MNEDERKTLEALAAQIGEVARKAAAALQAASDLQVTIERLLRPVDQEQEARRAT